MRSVIYARFSSDRQTEMSIDAQVRACQEYAAKHDLNIIHVYADEAISGTTNKRPQYQEMLSDAFNNQFDVILIHKYDRIARDLTEQVNLQSKLKSLNIKLIAVAQDYGEGKDANLTKGIQWVLGEYYSANLSEETRKGHKEIALKGLHNGGLPPFGYDVVDQRYVINELEAYWVRKMFESCVTIGGYTELVRAMADAGVCGKRGKPIKYSQIYEILRNEKYTGVYLYCLSEEPNRAERRIKKDAIRIEGAIPAIISKETFNEAQKILETRKNAKPQKHRCSGLIYCAECGAKMHLSRTKRKGHEYNNFVCSAKCGAHIVPVNFVDDAVDEYIKELFNDDNMKVIEQCLRDLKKYNKELNNNFEKEKLLKINNIQNEIDNIMKALSSGAFEGNYDVCNEMLTQKRNELNIIKEMKCDVPSENKIHRWLTEIVSQNYTPGIFIKMIKANTTSIEIISNFDEVVGSFGCGGTIRNHPTTLPRTLWFQKYNRSNYISNGSINSKISSLSRTI